MRSIFAEERLTGSEKDEFLSATYEDKEQVRKRRVVALEVVLTDPSALWFLRYNNTMPKF